MNNKTFIEEFLDDRPDVQALLDRNALKGQIAEMLRSLRKSRGMTQKQVAQRSGMTQSAVSRLESFSGDLPKIETVITYVHACGGHTLLGVSTEKTLEAVRDRIAQPDDSGAFASSVAA